MAFFGSQIGLTGQERINYKKTPNNVNWLLIGNTKLTPERNP